VKYDFGSLGNELASYDCTLAWYDMLRAVIVDVGLEV
jgi:hypothetical protein